MTIEECTNPAVCWERDRGFYTVPPLSEPEPFYLPEGIGWVECAHVEHEEVIAVGRTHELLKGVKKATFKYALGDEFIQAMEVFKSVNLHSTQKIRVGGCEVAPRDVVEAAAPDPNEIGKRYVGQTCGGTWVKGRKDGLEREVYLYQVADNEECVAKYGTQGVVAQTAFTRRHRHGAAGDGQACRPQGQPRGRGARAPGVLGRRLRRPDGGVRVPRRRARDGRAVQARARPGSAAATVARRAADPAGRHPEPG